MKNLGIEIEFTGVSREMVKEDLEKYFGTKARESTGSKSDNPYTKYFIKDNKGKDWGIIRDRSLLAEEYDKDGFAVNVDSVEKCELYSCELVSPVLTSEDIHTLFEVVNRIKNIGGLVNATCGIHVHIDKPSNFKELYNLFLKYVRNQENIYELFGVEEWRQERYCKKYDWDFTKDFSDFISFIGHIYSTCAIDGDEHSARYYGLNLHALKTHKTIEFRLFNGTLDIKEISGILNWVLNFCYLKEDIKDYEEVLV